MTTPAISMKWVEFDDGASYGVDLTVSGLASQAQAEAAMAHMQKLFCGEPINLTPSAQPPAPATADVKPAVQRAMDLARHFRAAPGSDYDVAYKELETFIYGLARPATAGASGLLDLAREAISAAESLGHPLCGGMERKRASDAEAALLEAIATSAPHREPVAKVLSFTNGSYWRNYKLEWLRDVPEGTLLYAANPQTTQGGADA